jgi:uncharacterized protein YggT (Ycf19 family)
MSPKVETRREVYVDELPVHRRQEVIRDLGAEHRVAVAKVAYIIWLLFGILDVLLLFRFALKLMNANPNNAFASFIYDLTALFMKPFEGLVESPTSGDLVLDISVLVAIVVYSLIAWVIVRLVWVLFYRPNRRVVSTYEEHD